MARKSHQVGTVTFASAGRRWKFNAVAANGGEYSLNTTIPGGAETAHKVARVINGAVKRTGKGDIDGLARANIATILHKAAAAVPRERVLSKTQGLFC